MPPKKKIFPPVTSPEDVRDEHIAELYHLTDAYPAVIQSRIGRSRNSKKNPNDLRCIGDKKNVGKALLSKINSEIHRERGAFVGLKNLGATCYMNTLMQVLYSNKMLRQAVYDWNGTENEDKICYQMMLLFAELQETTQNYHNPKSFASSIKLNTSLQEDVQEFYKCFISYIEEVFKKSNKTNVKHIIDLEYTGKSEYITKCLGCRQISKSASSFLELDVSLKDFDTLEECIEDYIGVEYIGGDNKYNCSNCGPQDAERRISVTHLPPVLNFQLLRFKYDPKLGKKKIMNTLYFPLSINTKRYFSPNRKNFKRRISSLSLIDKEKHHIDTEDNNEDYNNNEKGDDDDHHMYDLTAILLHLGASANGGHYIAHIRDEMTGKWWKFDDETVEPLKITDKIYCKDLKSDKKKNKKIDDIDDDSNDDDDEIEVKDNVYDMPTEGYFKSQNCYMLCYTRRNRKSEISKQQLKVPPEVHKEVQLNNEKYVSDLDERKRERENWKKDYDKLFTEYELLSKNLVDPGVNRPCCWISTDWIESWVLGEQHVLPDSKIDNSVFACKHDKLNYQMVDEMKRIPEVTWEHLMQRFGGGPQFDNTSYCRECVADYFLEQQAADQLNSEKKQDVDLFTQLCRKYNEEKEEGFYVAKTFITKFKKLNASKFAQDVINETITCEHSKLSTNASQRVAAVPPEAWKILCKYASSAIQYSTKEVVCSICNDDRRRVKEQRKELRDLYDKSSSSKHKVVIPKNEGLYYFVPYEWVQKWGRWIDKCETNKNPGKIDSSHLLCQEHKGLLFDPHKYLLISSRVKTDVENDVFYLVNQETWNTLSNTYDVQQQSLSCIVTSGGMIEFDPRPCETCINKTSKEKHEKELTFSDGYLNVEVQTESKTRRRGPKTTVYEVGPISATSTVYQLKLMIFQETEISPSCQQLFFDEICLDESKSTLSKYGIVPSKPLRLVQIDGGASDDFSMFYDDQPKASERGFENTMLRSSNSNIAADSSSSPSWSCEVCTFINSSALNSCEMCNTPKPQETNNTNQKKRKFSSDIDKDNGDDVIITEPTTKKQKITHLHIS
eukprot:TRINITY_DN7838_c0_g1_i1.p1 TRINITY_DN7838_c0_g1~~TRINITY_DN7838_c0_g1_i1.p1  ORF type:complete len:1066 (+),score=243.03 TRINITY_DN7838_c0_g1_i1:1573-4770(+)